MPPNQSKRCLLCGRHGHNLRTCPLPGASALRQLRAQQSSKRERKSRVLRGTGAAAARKRGPPMKKQWLKPAQRRKQYSGSFQKPSRAASGHRHWRGPSSTGQTPESALQELIQAGYVQIPDLCPTCHYGALEGPFARKDVQQPGHLHVRCKDWDCRARFNVLHFCPLLENIGRPLSVTPQKLLALVVQYLSKSAPRLYEAVHFNGLHNRVVLQVNDELRRLEANEGRRLLHKIRLKGDVELDATALRKVHISSTNEGWAPLVEDNFSTRLASSLVLFYHIVLVDLGLAYLDF